MYFPIFDHPIKTAQAILCVFFFLQDIMANLNSTIFYRYI